MIKTVEHRVGQDRPLQAIEDEAVDFLRQLRNEGMLKSESALDQRVRGVLDEIRETSKMVPVDDALPNEVQSDVNDSQLHAGGLWQQTTAEIEFGVRVAWKHSSKCIMRSEYSNLKVVDLRHVTTSKEMGTELLHHLKHAFNGGDVNPTTFIFPPRTPGQRGPMVWNGQLLSFAAYEADDGTILGDPANLSLTNAIIELGWTPPSFRTQWDLLPIVTMAEDDVPVITPLSEHEFPLVHITHPTNPLPFDRLGLRWVPAPALSRLGFDIGGVQYTATPFIGWFMDAEIGVRDLGDKNRYDMLPRLATSLGYTSSPSDLDRAPEHEKLAVLSKTQAELNFAVFHSFRQAGVMMTDTLSASSMYSSFDDEHLAEKGFRLPSNPYWLAPPQGSIVPIWHRGGAPNYQPAPLICRHVQDPVKAWKREKRMLEGVKEGDERGREGEVEAERKGMIHLFYCSAATTARKLTTELQRRLEQVVSESTDLDLIVQPPKTLNCFNPGAIRSGDKVFIVASTAGRGELPPNGKKIASILQTAEVPPDVTCAIFGNGNATYRDSHNAAANSIHALLKPHMQFHGNGIFEGDTSIADPPWTQFEQWLQQITRSLSAPMAEISQPSSPSSLTPWKEIIPRYRPATFISTTSSSPTGIQHVTLDIGDLQYQPLGHISILVPNGPRIVNTALKLLGLTGDESLPRKFQQSSPLTLRQFLLEFIDFTQPFSTTNPWSSTLHPSPTNLHLLQTLPLKTSLPIFDRYLISTPKSSISLQTLLSTLPLKRARTFSVASSQRYLARTGQSTHLELLVQSRHRGLISTWFRTATPQTRLRLAYSESKWPDLTAPSAHTKPTLCFATGSGFAPVRGLLQERIALAHDDASNLGALAPVSLFLGYRADDSPLLTSLLSPLLHPVSGGSVVDFALLTPSNPAKVRAQDKLFLVPGVRESVARKIVGEGANVFVCAGGEAGEEFAAGIEGVVGCDVRARLGGEGEGEGGTESGRWVQEIFKAGA
jgi:nitric oxide synthase oxygenase domain/subunit/sulfite reductase alpha subunit-like flavoprotein